jgi:hypothetical protein
MSSPATTSQSSSHAMMVEIKVQDPGTMQEGVFRCPLAPLRTNMRFFEPVIAKQMNEVKMAAVTSSSGTTPPLVLRAKCDHRTFEWLLDWMNGNAPLMTIHNIVSIALSSSFLQMRALTDESLVYLRSHLPEVVASSVDLMALPVELVLQLSRVVRDSDLAAALHQLYDRKSTTHPNRAFVASLLQHYVCYRLGLEGDDEEGGDGAVGGRADGKKKGAGRRVDAASATAGVAATDNATQTALCGGGDLVLKSSSGLRWCRLCAMLFDQAEMQRLIRAFQLSSPECVAQVAMAAGASAASAARVVSPALSSPAGAINAAATATSHNGGSSSSSKKVGNTSRGDDGRGSTVRNTNSLSTIRCVGPRGEVFTTHAESRRALPVVLDAPPLLRCDRAASTASLTAATMRLERWAWRIIGATRYVSCRRCFHLVPLIEVPTHHCSNLTHRFASPDNVADDVNQLVRWFMYCAERRVYAEDGGLTPILFNGPRHILAEEVVEVPIAPKPGTGSQLLPQKENCATDGVSSGGDVKDSSAGRTDANVAPSNMSGGGTELGKRSAASWPHVIGASPNPPLSFWANKPFYVAEVMDKGIVDIDIQNYVERQHRFEVEAQQRRASELFNPPLMRLASSPAAGSTTSSSPSPRLIGSASGASSTGSVNRGKTSVKPVRVRATARSPYGI